MSSATAKDLIARQERLAAKRTTWEAHWQECARYMLPSADVFSRKNVTPGEKRDSYITDPTAVIAASRGAAVCQGILTPRAQKWHHLRAGGKRSKDDKQTSDYLDDLTDDLFSIRYSPQANYENQQYECYMSLMVFGTAVKEIEDMVGRGIRYRAGHIAEHYIAENAYGVIDTDYRRYKMTARQAAQRFPDGLPPSILRAAEKDPEQEFEFLHACFPNPEINPDRVGPEGMAFASYHVSVEGQRLLGVGGYRTFPYIVSRFSTAPGEVYGRSPGMMVLAEIKMLNTARRDDTRARQKAYAPPILATNEARMRPVNMSPDAINYGGLDEQGNQLIRPFVSGARFDVTDSMIDQSRRIINDAFFVTVFQIMTENPRMTATEVMQRAQEKGVLLSPTMGRQQSEDLGPTIRRELDILNAYGGLGEMPPALVEDGGRIEIEYTSPLSRYQMADEAAGAQRALESLLPLAQIDPGIMDNIDLDAYAEIVTHAAGAPSKMLRSREQKEQIRAARNQSASMAQMVQSAPMAAGAIKDIAQAQAMVDA